MHIPMHVHLYLIFQLTNKRSVEMVNKTGSIIFPVDDLSL